MYNYLKDFLSPTNFHIDIYDNYIYITNYEKIITLGSKKTIIKSKTKKVILEGINLSLTKLEDQELLISGKITNMEIKYE